MKQHRVPDAPGHVQSLLAALKQPEDCAGLDELRWERLIRSARAARLLGVLDARLARLAPAIPIPEAARRHLAAGRIEARFRRQKIVYLLTTIEPLLRGVPCILLKGAGYLAQDLVMADGRLPSDVDIMVPRDRLDEVERALLEAGWQYENADPYDQHYYRAWSHELAPLQAPGQALELDVHHTILPPLGRLKPQTSALLAASLPVSGSPFNVLCAADQVLHAAAHLFQDSDCTGRLRDLVDIDALMRAHAATDASFWAALVQRAALHSLGRPLWYATAFACSWFDTPIPDWAAARIAEFRPSPWSRRALCALARRTLVPVDPDGEPSRTRALATRLLEARGVWLRMPPHVVAYHATHKLWRSLRRKPQT